MLTAGDYRSGLHVLQQMAEAATDDREFARRGVELITTTVASEITTLSVCDLSSGRREVTGTPPGAIGAKDRACFDRYFNEHPLVRYHARLGGRDTHRVSDCIPFSKFRETALYADYYRRLGIDHAVAVPLHCDRHVLVSLVLNRTRRDFTERDIARLELVREGLGSLYRHARVMSHARCAAFQANAVRWRLTARESEVVQWLARGKNDRDIGEILGISPRTVHKHLQRSYQKLGVETRTAAVLRLMALS